MIEKIFSLYLSIFNGILSPLLVLEPVLAILIISVALSLIAIAISVLTIDKEKQKKLMEKISALQEEMKAAQKDRNMEVMNRLAKEAMAINFQMLRGRMKGMVITLAFIILFFPWLSNHYEGVIVAKLPVINLNIGWIWWYIIVSIAASYVIKKLLAIEYA